MRICSDDFQPPNRWLIFFHLLKEIFKKKAWTTLIHPEVLRKPG